MKVIIAGAGAVGFNLARELSNDQHDITVIESDSALIQSLRDRLDVRALHGSATDATILRAADIEACNIFIAVTNSDEVNIVACMLAAAMEGERKSDKKMRRIARIRNVHLSGKESLLNKRDFKVSRIVNPDVLAAETAEFLIESPGVTFQADFAEGQVLMRAFKVPEGHGVAEVPLVDLAKRFPGRPFLMVAVDRGGSMLIPRGNDILSAGDTVYLLMLKGREDDFNDLVAHAQQKPQRVVVYGGSSVGLDIVSRIASEVGEVVLLEDSREVAERAADRFDSLMVLHGWVTDEEIQREVDFKSVDVFLAAGEDDRMNLVAALFAKQRGVRRTMVLAREPDVVPLLRGLQFDAVINARLLAVSEILRFVRPGKVLSVQKIGEGGAEAIELVVGRGSKASGRSLRELHLPYGAIVGAIYRDGVPFLPSGDTVLEVGDDIVAFVLGDVRDEVERMFAGSGRKFRFGSADPAAKAAPAMFDSDDDDGAPTS